MVLVSRLDVASVPSVYFLRIKQNTSVKSICTYQEKRRSVQVSL